MSFSKAALIDDDPVFIKIASMSLEKVGQKEVICFTSGQEFLHNILSDSDYYDVILIDENMPNMLGTETIDSLFQQQPNFTTPIIFLTGTSNEADVKTLFEHQGVIGVISKPFDPISLTSLIDKILEDQDS